MEEQFDKEIHALAQQIKGLHDQAVSVYTPLVDDICSRVASMKEVEWLLDYMFSFAGEERMLLLYKRVCRHYWQVYPEMIAWHKYASYVSSLLNNDNRIRAFDSVEFECLFCRDCSVIQFSGISNYVY